jgi:hypothetical protein
MLFFIAFQGALDDRTIEVELPVNASPRMQNDGKGGIQFGEFILKMDGMLGSKTQTKKMKISECRPILEGVRERKNLRLFASFALRGDVSSHFQRPVSFLNPYGSQVLVRGRRCPGPAVLAL